MVQCNAGLGGTLNHGIVEPLVTSVQGGTEKIAQSLMHCHFATICNRITRFHQNARKRSLSTSQCRICISWLNIL